MQGLHRVDILGMIDFVWDSKQLFSILFQLGAFFLLKPGLVGSMKVSDPADEAAKLNYENLRYFATLRVWMDIPCKGCVGY